MTARKAFAYLALWALLTGYLVVSKGESPVMQATPTVSALMPGMDAGSAIAVELRADDRALRCERSGGRWQAVAPAGVGVPTDLIAAILNILTQGNPVEVVSHETQRMAEFGLDPPRVSIAITNEAGSQETLYLGARNPAQTAVYARREGTPEIVLVGLNLNYYVDLALAATGES
jgi:hypothetical protein